MDLFVVNRHLDTDVHSETTSNENKLESTLSRIEKNRLKKLRINDRNAQKRKIKRKHIAKRILDKELKIIPVPEQIDYSDNELEVKKSKKQKKLKVAPGTEINGFTILGGEDFKKKSKVKRVLPRWLSEPRVISTDLKDLNTKVSSVKQLSKDLHLKLKKDKIKCLFPVQAKVIPYLLEQWKLSNCIRPNDICVSAPTGSGKTLAFVLPVIEALRNCTVKKVRALVILPTQELASQVAKCFKHYADSTDLDVLLLTGSSSFTHEQNQLISKNPAFGFLSKVDIVVCTAGRLVDHLKLTEGFSLNHLEFLIIDEADRVLNNVQNDWLYHLEKHIYSDEKQETKMLNIISLQKRRPPQKLLFSATLSQDPEKLQKLGLFQPVLFTSVAGDEGEIEETVGKYSTPQELEQKFVVTTMELKPMVLYELIRRDNLTRTLVFAHSLESAHRLKLLLSFLSDGALKVHEIGSKLDAHLRKTLINNFSNGSIDILICTDALARGIDLPGVQCVINYSAPKHLETYIHRAGRTARAGERGSAVTILTQSQLGQFNGFISQGGKTSADEIKIDEESLEPLAPQYTLALEKLKDAVQNESVEKVKKLTAAKRMQRKRKQSE